MISYYLSTKQQDSLRKILLKKYSILEQFQSNIAGTDMSRKLSGLVDKYMEDLYKNDPDKFIEKYVKYEFEGDEAITEFSSLLNTFIIANTWCRIKKRDITDELIDDYEGKSLSYPFGELVTIETLPEIHNTLISLFWGKLKRPYVTFQIYITEIKKIEGDTRGGFDVTLPHQFISFRYDEGITSYLLK